jgi:hypothetical protein
VCDQACLRFPQQSCPHQASIGVVLPPSGSKDALWLLSFPCFCRMAWPTIRARKSNSSSIGAYFFGALDLTETPSRIATLRIRSGARFIVFAISSSVLEALASSVTRRSCLNDQPLGISVQFVLQSGQAAYVRPMALPVPIVNPIRWQLIENRAMLPLDV